VTTEEHPNDEGGESACFAHFVCPECGVVIGQSGHQPWCAYVDPEGTLHAAVAEEVTSDDLGQ